MKFSITHVSKSERANFMIVDPVGGKVTEEWLNMFAKDVYCHSVSHGVPEGTEFYIKTDKGLIRAQIGKK